MLFISAFFHTTICDNGFFVFFFGKRNIRVIPCISGSFPSIFFHCLCLVGRMGRQREKGNFAKVKLAVGTRFPADPTWIEKASARQRGRAEFLTLFTSKRVKILRIVEKGGGTIVIVKRNCNLLYVEIIWRFFRLEFERNMRTPFDTLGKLSVDIFEEKSFKKFRYNIR